MTNHIPETLPDAETFHRDQINAVLEAAAELAKIYPTGAAAAEAIRRIKIPCPTPPTPGDRADT